ncbi:MAG: hypothetical protein IKM87_03565 [Clostridia bacterium]|nr:hypothetical protein [Clostridia bacterium]
MKITTKSGFALNLDKEALDDWKITEAIADAGSEDTTEQIRGIVALVKLIFKDQKKAYYAHVAAKHNGRVPNEVINEDVEDIFNQLKEAKNS